MAKKESKKNQPLPALEAGDYYFNAQGLLVFTAQYHLKRGYCCGSGCLHCPFGGNSKRKREHPFA